MTDTITITSGTYYLPGKTLSPVVCRTFHLTRVTPLSVSHASVTVDERGVAHAATRAGRSLPQADGALTSLVEHIARIYGQLTISPDASPGSILDALSQDETCSPYIRQNAQQKEDR